MNLAGRSLLMLLLTGASAQAQECAVRTRQDLVNYAQTFAARVSPLTPELLQGGNAAANETVQALLNMWRDCESIANLQGLGSCFARPVQVAQMLDRRRAARYAEGGNSMGFEMSDRDYVRSVPERAASLPAEFANGLPANWRELAAERGWPVAQYRSRFVGNPSDLSGESFNRVLILVNEEPYDKWVQFTVGDPDTGQAERVIDFVSIDRSAQPRRIFFTQFQRDAQGGNPVNRVHAGDSLESCVSCHPNGMRELNPVPGSYSAADGAAIVAMNERMRSYQGVDWGAAFTPQAYGPTIGMDQGCVRCHNAGTGYAPISRGALHPLTNPDHINHKMHDDLSMMPTTSRSRTKVMDFLANLPALLPDETRRAMMAELHPRPGASLFDHHLRVLEWLRTHNNAAGEPWISEPTYQSYTALLNAWRTEALAQRALPPGAEVVQEWMLSECDVHETKASINTSDRMAEDVDQNSPPQRSSDAISQ